MASPILKKLKFDDSKKCLIVNAPPEFTTLLKGLSYDNAFTKKEAGTYDYVQVFAGTQAEMEKLITSVGKAGKHDCIFWACYPKKTSKQKSDIQRETVWDALALVDLRTVSAVSIDDTWSALRGRPPEKVGK